jgi:biotin operon repressor BirA-like protein
MKIKSLAIPVLPLLSEENFISGEKLSSELSLSRVAVWKQIQKLKQLGYHISTDAEKVIVLFPVPMFYYLLKSSAIWIPNILGNKYSIILRSPLPIPLPKILSKISRIIFKRCSANC